VDGDAVMMLNASMILDRLRKKPGRYILRTMAHYDMREANGEEVECPASLLARKPNNW
jgi:hypothetical protein